MTVLETERLSLRPMRRDDAKPLMRLFGDPFFMESFGRGPFDESEMSAWVARNLAHQEQHGYGLFTIVLRRSEQVIGDCGLEVMELEGEREVELGYDLRRDLWGNGYATEAALAVVEHAFGQLGLHRLVSMIRVGNSRSARVAERLGMVREASVSLGVRYERYALGAPSTRPGQGRRSVTERSADRSHPKR